MTISHTTLRFPRGDLHDIPQAWLPEFRPASHFVREWETCWVHAPGATALRVGDLLLSPAAGDLFPLRFENQLGLARIQAECAGLPLGEPLWLEVISPKFPTFAAHREFLGSLLDELFSAAMPIPFQPASPTARGVIEAAGASSPFFQLHFFQRYGAELIAALNAIAARPHRSLVDARSWVSPVDVDGVDPEMLLNLVTRGASPAESFVSRSPGPAGTFSSCEGRLRPADRVLQRRAVETIDTPENRWAAGVVAGFLAALELLPLQSWWPRVPQSARQALQELHSQLPHNSFPLDRPILPAAASAAPEIDSYRDAAGALQAVPVLSLLRRSGYRELLGLWRAFQGGRQPLFGALEQAIALRDVAALYEVWTFFRLVEELAAGTGRPVDPGVLTGVEGPSWGASADFGPLGRLVYQHTHHPPAANTAAGSYSLPFRPDFTWFVDGAPAVVLDAKFRLEHERGPGSGASALPANRDLPSRVAGRNRDTAAPGFAGAAEGERADAGVLSGDIRTAHAYRDALRVRSAVILYPGELSRFYHRNGTVEAGITVLSLLRGQAEGVGAIALRPHRAPLEDTA